ncbi:MAG: hypothetical protein HY234_00060 [Acidobacteria bacterium]|nr:hypothetical protein [Acidobacteriota bacterium]MBI3661434.1 hypothetical protein [Acidobacteriota bacterium]
MKPQSLAVRLLVFLMLLTPVGAQTVASNGASPATPAPPKKKNAAVTAAPASARGVQQRQETPPPAVSGLAPRPAESTAEPGQTTLEIKYDVQGVNVQGNTGRSFLHACTRAQILAAAPGKPRICHSINTTTEFNFLNNVPVFGNFRLETSLIGRYTDNPRVDPERNSLQRAYLRLTSRDLEATLGDSLVNYSRFSFSQNIRGLHFWRQWTDNVKIIGTIGYFTDRWGSLYRSASYFRDIVTATPFNPAAPPKPYTRAVGGLRLERKAGKGGWAAFNYSRGKDLQQSLPDSTITCVDTTTRLATIRAIGPGCLAGEIENLQGRRSATEAVDNHVVSFDTNLDLQPLRLKVIGEFAYSWTTGGTPSAGASPSTFACATQPPVVGAAVLDARCFTDHVRDPAYRLEVSQHIGKLTWRTDYSRFQPNFSSANARQIRDLQDFNVRGDYQFRRQFGMTVSWRRSNDNLNGKRNYTSIVRAPEVRLTFRDLPFYRKFVLEVGYRERNLDTSGSPTAVQNRIRSTRIPFFGLTLPLGDSSFTYDYEHRHDKDAVVAQNSTDSDRFAFGFRGNYTWNNWDVIPSFRYELERLAKSTPNNAALALTDPTLIFPADFFGAHDTSRSFNAQLQIEAPRYIRFEGTYREFNSITLSPLRASIALDPLLRFFYLNQGFKRPSWRASLTYKFRNDENRLITAFYERGNNFFDTGDPFVADPKSFRETILGGTILLRFRH